MRKWRLCLFIEIFLTLVIIEGYSSEYARWYRKVAIRTFCRVTDNVRIVETLCQCLPNGNWENTSNVEVYVRPGEVPDRLVVVRAVCKGIAAAISGRRLLCFNRSRWTNNDKCVCRFGLGQIMHGLFGRTTRRVLVLVGYKGSLDDEIQPMPDLVAEDDAMDNALRDQLARDDDDEDDKDCNETDTPGKKDEPAAAGKDEEQPDEKTMNADGSVNFAAMNNNNRRLTWTFWRANPTGELIFIAAHYGVICYPHATHALGC